MARPTRTWMSGRLSNARLRGGLTRRLAMDGNPLRRRCDLIEAWLAPAGIALFVVLCPVLFLVFGVLIRADNAAVARAEQSWQPVTATLLRSVPGPAFPDNGANTWTTWTAARWTYHGQTHTGAVPATSGANAGSTETIWLNHAGHVQLPPMSASQVEGWISGDTLLAIGALALLLFVAVWLTRRVLDRRRIASWELDWLIVEPRWSRQT
jgi:hypothetical protein